MTLSSSEFRDPAALVDELARQAPFMDGDVLVVLVRNPSTEQRIVDVRLLETTSIIASYEDAREELREVVRSMPIPGQPGPPRHAVMTVLVRYGLCVFGPNESQWFLAWRYSNHLANTFQGDVILVTEHGWLDFMTGFAGLSPALAA